MDEPDEARAEHGVCGGEELGTQGGEGGEGFFDVALEGAGRVGFLGGLEEGGHVSSGFSFFHI